MLTRSLTFFALSCVFAFAHAGDDPQIGHSAHGAAFDTGLRTKPWKMEGLGTSPFPITTKNAEVQQWFNQGVALMHNFWFEEAERTFRWCLKLEPENPMVYWGLAYSGFNWFVQSNSQDKRLERYREFLKQAVRRKHLASERERMYIETWDRAFAPDSKEPATVIAAGLERIVLKFPEDTEAKALLAFYNIGRGSAFANQLIIEEILRKNPNHPGAHHASIHNWDGVSPENALRSCDAYGKVAPGTGHSLHMPGHVYTKVGKWHEAAWAMDAATRVELRYMNDRLALPFENWNFPHNRNYLCYIQEQLGMEKAALQGARDLLNAPIDPEYNPEMGGYYWEGLMALVRVRMKFERWDSLLKEGEIPWRDDEFIKGFRASVEALALAATGKVVEAKEQLRVARAALVAQAGERGLGPDERMGLLEIEGRIKLAEGDFLGGTQSLLEAAKIEDAREYGGDPPGSPYTLYRVIGDAYRKHGSHQLAVEAYERALQKEKVDAFVLSGLAECWAKLGNREKAAEYAAQFVGVWSNADADLPWSKQIADLGLKFAPVMAAKPYIPAQLDKMGPSNWTPYPAPALSVVDAAGAKVELSDFKGKNVVLVFYLSDQCAHCMEQLQGISKRSSEFESADTVVLAVCNAVENTAPMEGVRLLRDKDHVNARRFSSYDDFEEMELHSTILIDKQGRIRWKRTGGAPFADVEFLLGQLRKF